MVSHGGLQLEATLSVLAEGAVSLGLLTSCRYHKWRQKLPLHKHAICINFSQLQARVTCCTPAACLVLAPAEPLST